MIHYIEIDNFRSVRDRQVLDLRIPDSSPEAPQYRAPFPAPAPRISSTALLVGPNAAGKTTILDAARDTLLFAACSAAWDDTDVNDVFRPFASPERSAEPVRIRIELDTYSTRAKAPNTALQAWRYLLEVRPDSHIHELLEVSAPHSGKSATPLLRRKGSSPIHIHPRAASSPGRHAENGITRPVSALSTLAAIGLPYFRLVCNILYAQVLPTEDIPDPTLNGIGKFDLGLDNYAALPRPPTTAQPLPIPLRPGTSPSTTNARAHTASPI